jgi:hypothetical protein
MMAATPFASETEGSESRLETGKESRPAKALLFLQTGV